MIVKIFSTSIIYLETRKLRKKKKKTGTNYIIQGGSQETPLLSSPQRQRILVHKTRRVDRWRFEKRFDPSFAKNDFDSCEYLAAALFFLTFS